jgi:hypothetical protein
MSSVKARLQTITYRLGQGFQHLGLAAEPTAADYAEVARWLPPSAFPLFRSMSHADQQHSLRVCRGLQARGCTEPDMLAAALLHDVGKAQGKIPFWVRPAIVLGKKLAPRRLAGVAADPRTAVAQRYPHWRRALGFAWWHAEVGADLALAAGLSQRSALYIRTHHQPDGPAAELHAVDDVS